MLTADQARDRGVNAVRGLVIAIPCVSAFWLVVLVAWWAGEHPHGLLYAAVRGLLAVAGVVIALVMLAAHAAATTPPPGRRRR